MTARVDDLEDGLSSTEVFETFHWLNNFKELGVKQLPIKPKTKLVLAKGYTQQDYVVPITYWRQKKIGIGCITTGRFVDVDCDSELAIFFAKRLLPKTITFGRSGKPTSHYLYVLTGMELQKRAFTKLPPEGMTKVEKKEFLETSMMVEFRAANHMTVLPGSIHKSGETIEWTEREATKGTPTTLDSLSLFRKVQLIALGQILLDNDIWVEGQRQLTAGYIAGALYNAGVELEDARLMFGALSEYTEESRDDAKDRITYLEGTYRKAEDGHETGALGKLEEELNLEPRLVLFIRNLLQLKKVNVELGKLDLKYTKNGIQNSLYNIVHILTEHEDLKEKVRFNTFKQNIEYRQMPFNFCEDWQEWKDMDDYNFCYWLQSRGMQTTKDVVFAGVNVAAFQNRFSPIETYLNDLTWDGTERLDNWLVDYLDAECEPLGDSDLDVAVEREFKRKYLNLVGRKFLISAVARAITPGCKVDTMLVLEGKTGIGKSSVLAALMPDPSWMSEHLDGGLDKKDSMQSLRGKWIIELSELSSIRTTTDVESIKSFLSRRIDNYRSSYGRRNEDFPRQCVFFGTTNEDEYLKDYSGNRRFWPLKLKGLKNIQLSRLEEDRDQIWAEVFHAYMKGEKWYFTEAEMLELESYIDREQSDRIVIDVIDQEVLSIAVGLYKEVLKYTDKGIAPLSSYVVTTTNIAKDISKDIGGLHTSKKIGGILSKNKWKRKRARVSGYLNYIYEPVDVADFRFKHMNEKKEEKTEEKPYRSPTEMEKEVISKVDENDEDEY